MGEPMINNNEEVWKSMLDGTHPILRIHRGLYSHLPSNPRCRMCELPFEGVGGHVMRFFGKKRSNYNPNLCTTCENFARQYPGGAETELSMLFADIRGSTSLAETMSPVEFGRLIDRFFSVATDVLVDSNVLIDKLAGDQVSAYFIPGFIGPDHAQVAIKIAQELLQATGHEDPSGPWIRVGIGVHTGVAFVGTVGSETGVQDITALGDAVNITARLASNAEPGEILVSDEAYQAAGLTLDGLERRQLALKGREQPVGVRVLGSHDLASVMGTPGQPAGSDQMHPG